MLPAIPNVVGNTELRIRVDGRPSPNITPPILFLFGRGILLFRSDKTPDFVTLKAADRQVAYGPVMVVSTGTAHFAEQLCNGVLRHTCNSHCAADAVSFAEAPDHLGTLRIRYPIHTDHYAYPEAYLSTQNITKC